MRRTGSRMGLCHDDPVPPRLPSLRTPPIAFAHRGARAHAPENTIEAFRLAQRLGATGLESDVWLTADGVAVLDHDGVVGGRLRRTAIDKVAHAALPKSHPDAVRALRRRAAPTTSSHSTSRTRPPSTR